MAEYRLHKRRRVKRADLRWKRRRGRVEPAAGRDGRPLSGSIIRRNGRSQFVGDSVETDDTPDASELERSRLYELRRRLAKLRAQYRLSGRFTDLELTILDLAFDGHGLEAIGQRVGMSRQGVWYHVQKLLERALEFRNFWRYKHRMKGRK